MTLILNDIDLNSFGPMQLESLDSLGDDDLAQLERLLLQEHIDKGLESLYYFDKYILGYKDMEPKTHLPVCEFLSSDSRGSKTSVQLKKHLELPRGTFKSSVVTIGKTVHKVANNPDIRVLIDNEVYGNSKAFLREIKSHMDNEDVLALYPQLRPDKRINDGWTESSVIVQARTRVMKEPTISCAGLDQIKVGMHYDLIIMDDLVSPRNVTSREQIEKVIEHYKLALSLLEPDGEIIVLGTRYNYSDLYGYLLKNEADTFEHLIIPAKINASLADELNKRFPAIVGQYGLYKPNTLLFPERLTEEFLIGQRRSQGTYIYNCQYMLNPVDSETADFRREWLRYFRGHIEINPDDQSPVLLISYMGDHKRQPLEENELPKTVAIKKLITVDPNNKKKKTSDYTANMVVALTEHGDWFVVDMDRNIFNPGQIVNHIIKLQDQYEPDYLGLEENGKEAIQYMLVEKMRQLLRFFRIVELKTGGVAKEDRIKRLIPRFEYGTIYLPFELVKRNSYNVVEDLVQVIEDELLYFPVGEHDDLIDALAYIEDLVYIVRKKNDSKKRKKGNAQLMKGKSNLPRNRRPATVDTIKEEDPFV